MPVYSLRRPLVRATSANNKGSEVQIECALCMYELKERIVELQSENEAMKEILTVDQRSRLQLSLNRSFVSNCLYNDFAA